MHQIDPSRYNDQLADKVRQIKASFHNHNLANLEIFSSPPLHYRMRAEFRIWHDGDASFYAMTPPGARTPEPIETFSIGSEIMVATMSPLLQAIIQQPVLRKKLYGAEFLTTLSNQVLVTLIYHRPLDNQWQHLATDLANQLGIGIIGRSKKQKVTLDKDYVIEELNVDGKTYKYQQVESSFTQPNAKVNEKMLGWAKSASAGIGGDLLELYCGNGNFTVVLSENFDRVLATELSKISVRSALYNFALNNVQNAEVIRMSSEEFTDALNGIREFNRLKNIELENYKFSTIFVDPPRAGLDKGTLELASRFDNILYISCNPETLDQNLGNLAASHRVEKFALFDQFPYTHHTECGALLVKI